jgi:pimeloyl-ACP methyl ester carboxylesterase
VVGNVPPEVAAEGEAHQRPESDAVFASPCVFASRPSVPIRVLAGSDDRFFPVEFHRKVANERLGLDTDVLPGGHLIALAQPELVANYLLHT